MAKNKSYYFMTGVPIMGMSCVDCFFCSTPGLKEKRMPVCNNPYVGYVTNNTHSVITKCADEPKECKQLVYMVKNKNDIALIKKYIKKYDENGWIGISKKHYKWLVKKISIKNEVYLKKLFSYYGYINVNDKTGKTKMKILLTRNKIDKE